jgi:cysteine desulfurase/selenocysteine lyase
MPSPPNVSKEARKAASLLPRETGRESGERNRQPAEPAGEGSGALDVERLRRDFPVLGREVHGKPLVYLDNAATSQTPLQVLDAESRFYREFCANVHRGVHALSLEATLAYEKARQTAQRFLNAADAKEIVFLRGTTEAMNLLAATLGRRRVGRGDEVLITAMEHHSNIVPWQMLCESVGARLVVAPIDQSGELVFDEFERLLSERTRIVSVVHISNALGTILPLERMIGAAHAHGAVVVVDGAQTAPHQRIDVQALGCDFYAFSGHKAFGPTGIGVLWGRGELLGELPPYQGGGEMIRSVTFEKSTYADPPARFEAGTPNIAGAIGLGAALDYLMALDPAALAAHEGSLLAAATAKLAAIPGLRLIGTAEHKASLVSFVFDDVHAHDVGTVLDREGIAVRTGHHCAQPVMDFFGVPATVRASFAFYNTLDEVDCLASGLEKVRELFA